MSAQTAAGSINIAGTLTATGDTDAGDPVALSQVISEIEKKGATNYTIGPSASLSIPLNLSSGVTEALFLFLYCAAPLLIHETTSDLSSPGPTIKGLKGLAIWTYTPGEGLAALTVSNADPLNAVSLSVVLAAAPAAGIVPPYWVPPT